MKKVEFLAKLQDEINSGELRLRGSVEFARFFYEWLSHLSIPSDEKYDFYRLDQHLSQLAIDAWEEMRTGNDPWTIQCRVAFEKETSRGMSNILELDGESILNKNSDSFIIGEVLSAVMGDDYKASSEFGYYCRAQMTVLQGLFDSFIRRVYRKGLFEIISEEQSRGMKGSFGATELRTFVCAGRTTFTFARPKKRGEEVSVSFVAGDGDSLALESGIQSVDANLATAYNMIEDVISRWPKDTKSQKKLFRGNDNVAPLAILVARAQARAKELLG